MTSLGNAPKSGATAINETEFANLIGDAALYKRGKVDDSTTGGSLLLDALDSSSSLLSRTGAEWRIYGELRPFVGLEGVSVQVLGLRGIIYNIPGASADPAKDATGLSSSELEQLDRPIRDDIAVAFREQGVPLLDGTRPSPDTAPRLEVGIHWMNVKPGLTVIDVTTRMREPARLIKDSSKIVWAETWGTGLGGYPTSPESLVKDVRQLALVGVHEFLQLYARAHAAR